MRAVRVVINAAIPAAVSGGVEQIVVGLASGLAEVAEPGEEYIFLTTRGEDAWLRPHIRGACRIVHRETSASENVRKIAKRIPGLAALRQFLLNRRPRASARPLPLSDGTAEQLDADVVHFPYQTAFLTSIPSIYHPWDLQHVHYPQFFTAEQLLTRDLWYRTFCDQATVVSVATEWGKRDLELNLQVSPQKIEVIPVAPVLSAYAQPPSSEIAAVKKKYELPPAFAYFPAQTWPHKNHLGLIRALALLRSRGSENHLVFSGMQTEHARVIRSEARQLGVLHQLHFLGFVSALDLQCMYRLATCLVYPSRFEGWGLPVTEAFLCGLPVASSDASCLRETSSGAALLFDPADVEAMAAAVERLMTDEALRSDLIRRGREVASRLSWTTTASRFRQLYLRLSGALSG